MTIFKFIQILIFPSVFTFILIFLGLILLLARKQKIGVVFTIAGFALYYFFSLTVTSDMVIKPLENKYQQVKKEQLSTASSLVYLMGGGENNILRLSEVLRLYKENPDLVIYISGTGDETSEAKNYLMERGVPEEKIILENKSLNTFESAENIKKMIGEESFFLVTSAYHMPRSMESFQKIGAKPIAAPTDFKVKKFYDIFDIFPNPVNLEKSDLAFHEYFGILFYRLKYY